MQSSLSTFKYVATEKKMSRIPEARKPGWGRTRGMRSKTRKNMTVKSAFEWYALVPMKQKPRGVHYSTRWSPPVSCIGMP